MNDRPWLRYKNQGATRNQPVTPALAKAFDAFAPDMGLTIDVFSGGQPGIEEARRNPLLRRTGSTRHDHGQAADVFFSQNGRQLDWANPQDRPIFQDIVRRGKAAGITGFGAGPGYMQPGSMHVGFGHPGVWGAGGRGANAPAWLVEAFNGAPVARAPTAVAQSIPIPREKPVLGGMQSAPPIQEAYNMVRPEGSTQPQPPQPPQPYNMARPAGPIQPQAPAMAPEIIPPAMAVLAGGGVMPPGAAMQPGGNTLGNLALMFLQGQQEKQKQREEEAQAEQIRRAALFGDGSGLFGLTG